LPGDGRAIETLTNVVGSYDATGALVELRGYLIDVTASVEAESALLLREQLFRAVFFGASDAMMLLDDRRVIVDANPAASELFGRELAELTNEVLDNLFIDEGGSFAASWREFIALGEAKQEHRVQGPLDGNAPGAARAGLGSSNAATEPACTRAVTCASRGTSRSPSGRGASGPGRAHRGVGRLAGGIATISTTCLTAILGYTELLAHRRSDDPAARISRKSTQRRVSARRP
jgi:hypothetical protein